MAMPKKSGIWLLIILAIAVSIYGQRKPNDTQALLQALPAGTPIEPIKPLEPIKPFELPEIQMLPEFPMSLQRPGQGIAASPSPSVMSPLNAQGAEKAASGECSKQADAKGLHGVERKNFRAGCKAAFQ